MEAWQKELESMFCPPLDSALVAAIVNDENDANVCLNILISLAKEANLVLDAERESEFSENCSSIYKSSTDFGENGNESITSAEYQTDNHYTVDDLDSESICLTGDEIPLDEEIERFNFVQNEVEQSSMESPKEFLKACFPRFSEDRIDILLQENDYNAINVVDIVLSEIILAEQKNFIYYDPFPSVSPISTQDEEDNFLSSDTRFKHRKKKRHRKPKQQGIIIFQNNALRPNSISWSNPSSPQMSSSSSSSSSSSVNLWPPLSIPKTPPDNFWKTNEKNFNREQEIFDKNLSQLVNIFPEHEFQNLKNALTAANGEINNAIESLLKTPDINGNNGKNFSQLKSNRGNGCWTSHDLFLSDGAILNTTRKYQDTQKKINIPVNSRNCVKSTPITSTSITSLPVISKSLPNNYTHIPEDEEDDPEYCRQQAQECMKKRNEAFKKAANAFQKSKGHSRNGEGGIAFYYSTEGRKFDTEMKQWNLQAARSMVKRQSKKSGDDHLLDLHGLSVNEALTVVKERLNEWYPREIRYGQTPSQPLKIITGLGNHSPNGVAKLRTAINRFLVNENWDISEYKGYVVVKGVKS